MNFLNKFTDELFYDEMMQTAIKDYLDSCKDPSRAVGKIDRLRKAGRKRKQWTLNEAFADHATQVEAITK